MSMDETIKEPYTFTLPGNATTEMDPIYLDESLPISNFKVKYTPNQLGANLFHGTMNLDKSNWASTGSIW